MNYSPFIIFCSSISALLPFLASIAILRHSNKRPKTFVLLSTFFALSVFTEITLHIHSLLHKQSAWIFHIYTVIEYVLITIILANWQSKPPIARLMRISIPIYIFSFVLVKAIGLENFEMGLYNTITRPLAVLLLSTFAFLALQTIWRHVPSNLTDDYRFWMLLAMLLYYCTSLVIFAFMFTKDQNLLDGLFKIHAVINIIHNILFTIGVFKVGGGGQAAIQPTSAP